MKILALLLVLVSCSHGRLPISKDYEDQSLLMCSYVLKPQETGKRGYEFNFKKFAWKDWNWRQESKYIKLDNGPVKKVLILGSKQENGSTNRIISSVYFVNYSKKKDETFWRDFDRQNDVATRAEDIAKLSVEGWSALGQDYTYMSEFGLQRIYDTTNCGISCIRYYLIQNDRSEEDVEHQCEKQIRIFELEGQGPAFVHRESYEEE